LLFLDIRSPIQTKFIYTHPVKIVFDKKS